MKIQTGTNINCKPQTTFALSGIACFIAFLLSGTFAVSAPAPSVQPQKPDISSGTDPVRPTDLESTPPKVFFFRHDTDFEFIRFKVKEDS